MASLHITSPLDKKSIERLKAGDTVLISGVVYTARDAAHKRMAEALGQGWSLPVELKGQTVYYMGPSPAPPGHIIGACGPTTSSRMDPYTPALLGAGVKALLGKGERSSSVKEAMKQSRTVYFVTFGGAGALLAKAVEKAEVVAYPELGAEAVMRLEVKDLPAIVANDIHGGDLFEQEIGKYKSNNQETITQQCPNSNIQ
jgi:fumarate hydratase subunit beta